MGKTTKALENKIKEMAVTAKVIREVTEEHDRHKGTPLGIGSGGGGMKIDAILDDVKRVQASLSVMNSSIGAFCGQGDQSYSELQALIFHVERITDMNLESIDQIVAYLKESGAKEI